ncbi:MAG: S-methyl-5'-thioadenosine phosphorylase [Alphaproteobacteria bacterium]|nr:S-methyl-5'-thioadenosine phosphorylase [Alphaproteobacteria bacterium]
MLKTVLGIIGGSGVYDVPMENARWERVESPWGEASDALRFGEIGGLPVVFLPRHGRGHVFSPSSINYRANIDCLKRAGVTDLISLSAVGSLKVELPPGTFVLVDQFIDKTFKRESSFFGTGCVAHVPFGHPVSPHLLDVAELALKAEQIAHHRGGTLVVMEGPQFSTLAESELHRSWGASLIGMTAMPEAKLAREAEICYANIAMVTDFDAWHPHHDAVDVSQVVQVMKANVELAKRLVLRLAANMPRERVACAAGATHALDHAIMTAPEKRDTALLAKLSAILAQVNGRS